MSGARLGYVCINVHDHSLAVRVNTTMPMCTLACQTFPINVQTHTHTHRLEPHTCGGKMVSAISISCITVPMCLKGTFHRNVSYRDAGGGSVNSVSEYIQYLMQLES